LNKGNTFCSWLHVSYVLTLLVELTNQVLWASVAHAFYKQMAPEIQCVFLCGYDFYFIKWINTHCVHKYSICNLKMQGLNLDTLLIGRYSNMLSILNDLSFKTKIMCFRQRVKPQQNTRSNIKILARDGVSNHRPLASQADAISLNH